jgi:DNA polymerase-4
MDGSGIRKIIHIDMDAFFAAVEQRDFPELKGKPVIVGGQPNSRGVVAACSYEARKYGIHSAMPSSQAYRLCPSAIFRKPRFDVYRQTSLVIRKIFYSFTDLVEPASLDEAYLDVSQCAINNGSATLIAKDIKQKIKLQTRLIASAGVSYNKFLAKIASDMDKPDGLFLITPEQAETFIEDLAIRKFHGIGKATEAKMIQLGISNGKDLKQLSLPSLKQNFGKTGLYYYNIARGIDQRPIRTNRPNKSIGVETTFQQDILNTDKIIHQLLELLQQALEKTAAKNFNARTLTIKIKYHDFEQITRSRTLANPIINNSAAKYLLEELINTTEVGKRKVRLLGITLSSLEKQTNYRQMDLFDSETGNYTSANNSFKY